MCPAVSFSNTDELTLDCSGGMPSLQHGSLIDSFVSFLSKEVEEMELSEIIGKENKVLT